MTITRMALALALLAPIAATAAAAQPVQADSRWATDDYAEMDEAQRRWDDAQARFERERDALERERLAYDQARARFDRNRARSAAYDGPTWAGPNGEVQCRRPDGTTGTIIGGVAGALLGRAIDGGRRSAVGTILGGGAGALAGRAVERGRDAQCR
jgi:hypothetical protein